MRLPTAGHKTGMSHDQSQPSARMLLLQKDSWAVDYQATRNVLEVAREKGAQHFVLLSAICVQKPLLEFQHAKLKLEAALQSAGDISYSIVRPTAFFKSLAGQVRMAAAAFLCSVSGCLQPDAARKRAIDDPILTACLAGRYKYWP